MQEYSYEFAEFWFNVPTRLEKAGELWLVRAGRNKAKSNYSVGPKVIDCYGFHFVMEGKIRLEFEDGPVVLQKNDLFCLLPDCSYSYRIYPSSEPLQMVWITLNGGQLPELLAHLGIHKKQPFKKAAINRSIRMLLAQLIDLFASKAADPLLRQSLLLRLFALLSGEGPAGIEPPAMEAADAAPGAKHSGISRPDYWLTRSVEYIQLHYSEPVSVEEMARLAGVHRSHFSSAFTKATGLSPQQFLLRLRMEKAGSLLESGALSITETAHSVGYPDVYSFSRSFKKYYGRSPSMWTGSVK